MTEADRRRALEERIQALVDAAPPLTPEQRDFLALLLGRPEGNREAAAQTAGAV